MKERHEEMKVFSKEKMLERLKKEERLDEVDRDSREIMDKIDGLEVHKNHFKALVHDQIEGYVVPPELGQVPVNYKDTVEKTEYDQTDTGN